jgi:hypothetical protein
MYLENLANLSSLYSLLHYSVSIDGSLFKVLIQEDPISDWLKAEIGWSNVLQDEADKQNDIKFPDNVKSFVLSSGLPNDALDKIAFVIQNIENFLISQKQEFKITPELFVDPEESESDEIKIRVEIKKDLEYIYNNLRSPIYDIVIKTLSKDILARILIKLEPF